MMPESEPPALSQFGRDSKRCHPSLCIVLWPANATRTVPVFHAAIPGQVLTGRKDSCVLP